MRRQCSASRDRGCKEQISSIHLGSPERDSWHHLKCGWRWQQCSEFPCSAISDFAEELHKAAPNKPRQTVCRARETRVKTTQGCTATCTLQRPRATNSGLAELLDFCRRLRRVGLLRLYRCVR